MSHTFLYIIYVDVQWLIKISVVTNFMKHINTYTIMWITYIS